MKLFRKFTAIALIAILSFCQSGCSNKFFNNETKEATSGSEAATSDSLQAFDDFTNELFAKIAVQNTLNLHSLVQTPENYGISNYEVTLGSFKTEDLISESDYSNDIRQLKTFDRNELSTSQQITFDELTEYFETEAEYGDLYMFWTQLTPTTGIQVSLPIIFAEYSFDKKTDIDNYIALLTQTDRYFGELIDFERLRSEKGLFMEDSIADQVIDQCNTFLNNSNNNYLLTTFNDRIDAVSGLTEQEKSDYKAANVTAVNTHVLPAYSSLVTGLTALKGSNKYAGGLCNSPSGKEYYEYLLKSQLGWSKSVDELDALLDKYINLGMLQMSALMTKTPTILDNFDSFSFSLTDPQAILTDLKQKIQTDFPVGPDIDYKIKYIDKSLEAYSSPAMYFLPQIDNFSENAIYINNANSELSTLYATLAHEGYPGHMYQSTYFASLDPSPIRTLLRPNGFVEGWASYCELYSYALADSSDNSLNLLMQANYQTILMIYSKVDIGINYYGWTLSDTQDYLAKYNITDTATINKIYETMVAEPCNYPKYSIGCAAFMEFKNTAQTSLGDKFDIKEFHRFLMELGPVQFDIVEKELQSWITKQQ